MVNTDNSEKNRKVLRTIIEHAAIADKSTDTSKPLTPTTCSLASEVIEQCIEETTI